jgi:IstB-like ATP binding protein
VIDEYWTKRIEQLLARSRPWRVRRPRPTGQTVATGVSASAWGRCNASGPSCAGRGTACGGSHLRWTGRIRWTADPVLRGCQRGARAGPDRQHGALVARAHPRLVLDPPGSVGELNTRAARWLTAVVDARPHRVIGEPPAERLVRERPLLAPLPRMRYDTARRQPRRVGRVPLVEVDGARYSVPPELAGQLVEVRLPMASATMEIRSGGQLVARHRLAAAGRTAWDPGVPGRAEARLALVAAPGRHLRAVGDLPLAELLAEEAAPPATAGWPRGCALPTSPPGAPWPSSTSTSSPRSTASWSRPGIVAVRGRGPPRSCSWAARLRQEPPGDRSGYTRGRGWLPRLLHLRRRPGGHHHERLCRRQLRPQDPHLHRPQRAGDRRRRAHAHGPRRRQRPVPGDQPPRRQPSTTIVTTNHGLPAWGELFGDPVVAAAILDRLLHRAVVINIKGPSWRLREHQGLVDRTRAGVGARI